MSEALTSDINSFQRRFTLQPTERWSQGLLGHGGRFNLLHIFWESLIIIDHAVVEGFG